METAARKEVYRTGMGAIPHQNGTAFRVWAPHAEQVFVMGSFNNWSRTEHPLRSEENGYWYADVPGAKAGQEYKFLLKNGEQELERIDPYARQVTNSVGKGVIYDHAAYSLDRKSVV